MTIDLLQIVLICLVVAGIVWVYPRLPPPGNWILVVLVAVICVVFLLKLTGLVMVR